MQNFLLDFYTRDNTYCCFTFDLNCISAIQVYLLLHQIFFFDVSDSFILVIKLNRFKFGSSILLETHILLDKSSRVLQLQPLLSKLFITGQWCNLWPSSSCIKSKAIVLAKHGSLFNNIYFITNDLQKLNNNVNTCSLLSNNHEWKGYISITLWSIEQL